MNKNFLFVLMLVIIVGAVLFLNLGSAVRFVIEEAGSRALGIAVRVRGLDISLADKSAEMSGLTIANPAGFKADYILKTDAISVVLGDVTADTVVIKEARVNGMTLTYELGPHGTNFDALRKNLNSTSVIGKGTRKESGVSVIVQKLIIKNAQIIPALGGMQKQVSLPEIVLSNIGSAGHPASPVDVARQVMDKVLAVSSTGIMKSGLGAPVNKAIDRAASGLKGLLSR